MKTKFTPGPWKARYTPTRCDGIETWCIDWSDDQEEVAEIVHGEANAALIAAAPELYEALETMVAIARFAGWDKATTGRQIILRDAESILAKARGES